MFDPRSLVGKEVRALGDKEYGHRVLIYHSDIQKYVVETIYWNDGRIVNPDYLGSVDLSKLPLITCRSELYY